MSWRDYEYQRLAHYKKSKIFCNTQTDGPMHLPKALRNTVNSARCFEMSWGVDDEHRKITPAIHKSIDAQKTVVSPLSISVVLSAALALKSDSSFLWTSALVANTNDSGSGQGTKVLPWLSRQKSNQKKQSI